MSNRLQTRTKAPSTPKSSFTSPRTGLLQRKPLFGGTPGLTGEFTESRRKRLVSQPPLIQAKLTINQPNDRYEQEADRVADAVMRMPDPCLQRQVEPEEEEEEETLQAKPLAAQITPLIQRQVEPEEEEEEEPVQAKLADGAQVQRQEEEPEEEEEEPVQTKQTGGQTSQAGPGLQAQIRALRGGGQPLSPSTRDFFEPRFGYDFSQVRVHNDARAAEIARTVNARAFAVGRDIVFGRVAYVPSTPAGGHLLAHELTHIVQQTGKSGRVKPETIQRTIGDGHDLAAPAFSGNAILEAVYDNERRLDTSSRGAAINVAVQIVQNALIGLGYDFPQFGADGIYGRETEDAVNAFQQDVGLVVDGVVGFRTIDYLDKRIRGAEVEPVALPVAANVPFNTNNAIVQPGAAPVHYPALGAGDYGYTDDESVDINITTIRNGPNWDAVLTGLIGNYSIRYRILPTQTEVTGIGGNTNAGNYCAQVTEMDALGYGPGHVPPPTWYRREAVLAHERVHATRLRPALVAEAPDIETDVEAINVPHVAGMNVAGAEAAIRATPAFHAIEGAHGSARTGWDAEYVALIAVDHGAGGPTDTAEHRLIDPVVQRICAHAVAHGWPHCAVC